MGFILGTLAMLATAISTEQVSRVGYGPTTVSTTRGKGAFPLHS